MTTGDLNLQHQQQPKQRYHYYYYFHLPSSHIATLLNKGTPERNMSLHPADANYTVNEDELNKVRKEAPWTKDPKYFKKVSISPTAIMKMVSTTVV